MLGMFMAFFFILGYLPTDMTFGKALKVAGASDKLNILNFDFNTDSRYTFWSGITGGMFLALAYFGTDQSQVQRYLSGKSIRESQLGLIFNAVLKIPMQFFILLVGVMVFVFYQYNPSPLNFNPAATQAVLASEHAEDYQLLEEAHRQLEVDKKIAQDAFAGALELKEYSTTINAKQQILDINRKERNNREAARQLIEKADPAAETNDKDYVFIHFILHYLPRGLIGLLLAVILSAAMSSTASELNALGTITALDLYKRNRPEHSDPRHYVRASRFFTLVWGALAIMIACVADLFDNLIQLVNIIGSIFYGNVLGIFLLAFFFRFVRGNAVFVAALITQVIVIVGWYFDWMSYLWLNAFGCTLVIVLALFIEAFDRMLGKPPIQV
jgi:Na+/proline symporter